MSDEEFITVAEAAARAGYTIPRLRRLLARPEYAWYCKTIERETRTGTRTALVIPVSLLSKMDASAVLPDKPEQEQEQERNDLDVPVQDLRAVYERIIAEKDARIKDLIKALEHERERSRKNAEAYARVQTLLSVSNPP